MKLSLNFRRRGWVAGMLLCFALDAVYGRPVTAQVFDWNNSSSTLAWYDVPENWNPTGPPNLHQTARFALPGTYQVWWDDLTGHTSSRYLQVQNGHVTFVSTLGHWSHTVDYYPFDSNTQITNSGHLQLGLSGQTMDLFTGNLFVTDGQLSVTSGSRLDAIYARVGSAAAAGGRVNLNNSTAEFQNLFLGYNAGELGRVQMSNSNLTVANNFIVGVDGRGILDALSGSQIQTASTIINGSGESVSSFRLSGNSTWTNSGSLTIGNRGNTFGEINSGSVLQAQSITLANQADSFARLDITGNGSTLTTNSSVAVGFDGFADVKLSQGGRISALTGSMIVGARVGSDGFVEVTDSGSQIDVSGLFIGGSAGGAGFVTARNQARINAFSINVGEHEEGQGRLIGENVGTLIQTTNLTLSDSLNSSVTIRSGARLESQNTMIKGHEPNSATLTIRDTGTTFANSGNLLMVGDHSQFFIENGANAVVNGMTALWPGVGGTPLMQISNASFTGNGGIQVDRGTVQMMSANVTASINNGNFGFVQFAGSQPIGTQVHGSIQNSGFLEVFSNASNTIHGDLSQNGFLYIAPSSHLIVNGQFSGTGEMWGGGLLEINGTLSPGNSTASVVFDGSLRLGEFAASLIELGGLGSGQFDQLLVSEDLELNGELIVSLIDGHSLKAGDWYLIADIGGSRTGFWNGLSEGDIIGNFGGRDLFITYAANNGTGVALFTAIPEPSSVAIMGMLTCVLCCIFSRRRSRPV